MTDYHVVYLGAPSGTERAQVAQQIESECDREAMEGWLLDHVVLDSENGSTRGMWLIFCASEDVLPEGSVEVAAAERILSGREEL